MGVYEEKKETCGTICLKYLLFTFNFLFWVSLCPVCLSHLYLYLIALTGLVLVGVAQVKKVSPFFWFLIFRDLRTRKRKNKHCRTTAHDQVLTRLSSSSVKPTDPNRSFLDCMAILQSIEKQFFN